MPEGRESYQQIYRQVQAGGLAPEELESILKHYIERQSEVTTAEMRIYLDNASRMVDKFSERMVELLTFLKEGQAEPEDYSQMILDLIKEGTRLRKALGIEGLEDSLEALLDLVQEGDIKKATEGTRNMTRLLTSLKNILEETKTLETEQLQTLVKSAQQQRDGGMGFFQSLTAVMGKGMRDLGVTNMQVVGALQRIIQNFGKGSPFFSLLYALYEIGMFLYTTIQDIRMFMRTQIEKLSLPGATAIGRTVNETMNIMGRFNRLMDNATRDLGITRQEFMNLQATLKTTGLLVEGVIDPSIQKVSDSFESLSDLIAEKGPGSVIDSIDRYVRRLYLLEKQTGLASNTLAQGAMSIMRLTGSRDFELALGAFVRLHDSARRAHIQTQEFARSVMDVTNSLRWFGFQIDNNMDFFARYSQLLRTGALDISAFVQQVKGMTEFDQRRIAIGFWNLLQEDSPLGRLIQRVAGERGMMEAYSMLSILREGPESFRQMLRSQNETTRRTAQEIQRIVQSMGYNINEIFREAGTSTLEGINRVIDRATRNQGVMAQTFLRRVMLGEYGISAPTYGLLDQRFRVLTDFLQSSNREFLSDLKEVNRKYSEVSASLEQAFREYKSVQQEIAGATGLIKQSVTRFVTDIFSKSLKVIPVGAPIRK